MQKPTNLERAWRRIKASSNKSSSPYIRDDAEKFLAQAPRKIRSIAGKLQHSSYSFSPARGVAIEKKGKPGSTRPIVMPCVEDRIVQRCMLDALTLDPVIAGEAFQPNSFGGIPIKSKEDVGGVSAAIKCLLENIKSGGTHIMIADISKFFTRIKKSDVISKLSSLADDPKFIDLFTEAIEVDLLNAQEIARYKHLFPYDDVGVGQGVCLSPFVGNLVLAEFDKRMNEGDCSCIRYIDDIVIIAPNGKAASSRMRLAKRLLADLGMEISEEKSSPAPIPVDQRFEYLGIEFTNGLLRPSKSSRLSILNRCQDVAASSLLAMRTCKDAKDFKKENSIPRTLEKISGMARGWAHHYKFCNDIETVRNVDRSISKSFLLYANKAQKISQKLMAEEEHDKAARFLGYTGARNVKFEPIS